MASDSRHGLFVGSAVDDAGLDPFAFRILCRIVRRGQCTESMPKLARRTRMGEQRCREAIQELVSLGLVERDDIRGVGMRLTAYPCRIGDGYRIGDGSRVESDTAPVSDSIHKGIPSKVFPEGLELRSENEPRKPKRDLKGEALTIYEAYPRKRNRAAALKAIEKALKVESFDFLLSRTEAYARARSSEDPQFTPYPARWFNAEGYHDEPEAAPKPKRPTL